MAHSGGTKRSSWLIFRRRLIVVRRLLRGPATSTVLWDAACAELGPAAWGASPLAALRHDLHALRTEFGCVIRHRSQTGYHLVDPGHLYLLDLSDEQMQAMQLLTTLSETLPAHVGESLADLLEHLVRLLPPNRRQTSGAVAGERFVAPQSVTDLDRTLLQRIRRTVGRQQLVFRYRSTSNTDPHGITHRVAPHGLLIRDGHLYLDADCLEADGPDWRPCRVHYRLDRIVCGSLQVLPEVVPPLRLPVPIYALQYVLTPAVARQRDVALHFAGSQVTYNADGSALITATIDDLWHARLVLLRYGAQCHVLSPPELVAMIRETIRAMAAVYEE